MDGRVHVRRNLVSTNSVRNTHSQHLRLEGCHLHLIPWHNPVQCLLTDRLQEWGFHSLPLSGSKETCIWDSSVTMGGQAWYKPQELHKEGGHWNGASGAPHPSVPHPSPCILSQTPCTFPAAAFALVLEVVRAEQQLEARCCGGDVTSLTYWPKLVFKWQLDTHDSCEEGGNIPSPFLPCRSKPLAAAPILCTITTQSIVLASYASDLRAARCPEQKHELEDMTVSK